MSAVAAVLATAATVHAHRLEAEYRVLAGHRIQVESWFDPAGNSPRGARVQVYDAYKALLTEGELDENGMFEFSFPVAKALRVVISVAGHTKELKIPAEKLAQPERTGTAPSQPFADRSPRVSLGEVLSGVAFLLAIGSFAIGLRNARRLRVLEERLQTASQAEGRAV